MRGGVPGLDHVRGDLPAHRRHRLPVRRAEEVRSVGGFGLRLWLRFWVWLIRRLRVEWFLFPLFEEGDEIRFAHPSSDAVTLDLFEVDLVLGGHASHHR